MRIQYSAIIASATIMACLAVGGAELGARQAAGGAAILLPGTRQTVFSSIQGQALTASNASMGGSVVRLRDARVGRIVNTVSTDKSGTFAFRTLDPGSYIVEIVNNDAVVVATSQIVNLNAGEAVSTIVKLPFRIPPFAGVLGQSTQVSAAQAVVSAAASTGVLTSGPLDVCVSGPC